MPSADPACLQPMPGQLSFATPAAWAASLVPHVGELLVDQAQLEKKAAAGAVSFLFRVPGGEEVQRALSALGREELVHFERSLRLLAVRGVAFVPQPPSAYAERCKRAIRSTMPERLADELLVAAIIEARSSERMALLAEALRGVDGEVSAFYADLVEAEARHQELYAELAARALPAGDATKRWRELVAHEASVLQALPWAARLHGGLPAGR